MKGPEALAAALPGGTAVPGPVVTGAAVGGEDDEFCADAAWVAGAAEAAGGLCVAGCGVTAEGAAVAGGAPLVAGAAPAAAPSASGAGCEGCVLGGAAMRACASSARWMV
jgi:hypothetical protein